MVRLQRAVQSRPSNYTNSVFKIAEQPKMVSINSAIGVDLHGNIWADSLEARKIYSGVGGQSDFIRGSQFSEGGVAMIAPQVDKPPRAPRRSSIVVRPASPPPPLRSTKSSSSPNTVRSTRVRLSLGERAVGIAHLAKPREREKLLKIISDSPAFHKPESSGNGNPRGFTPYEEAIKRLG